MAEKGEEASKSLSGWKWRLEVVGWHPSKVLAWWGFGLLVLVDAPPPLVYPCEFVSVWRHPIAQIVLSSGLVNPLPRGHVSFWKVLRNYFELLWHAIFLSQTTIYFVMLAVSCSNLFLRHSSMTSYHHQQQPLIDNFVRSLLKASMP